MAHAFADVDRGITLCYETFGDPGDPTLLLIGGLGSQMIEWRTELCGQLVDRGFHVVRFDNRDAGLSTFLPEPVDVFGVFGAVANGEDPTVPYLLSDMAGDAVGLLDHLGVDRAHVVGMSLGGMIAQMVAIEHPARVVSLSLLMTTTGDPDVGMPTPEAVRALTEPAAPTLEDAEERRIAHSRIWGSPGLWDEDDLRESTRRLWHRCNDPRGAARQLAAILASGSRSEQLRRIDIPTLIIHGTEDRLVVPSGGQRLAEVIPGAELLMIEGMGHDLARPLWPRLVEAVTTHAAAHPAVPSTDENPGGPGQGDAGRPPVERQAGLSTVDGRG
jgi:pimeloyl-ACP methyl ester carboxylesterase